MEKLSDVRFAKKLATYESEQSGLQERVNALSAELTELREKALNVDRFLKLVDECTEITELTVDIARRFISKIVVHESVYETYMYRKAPTRRIVSQEVHIHYFCTDEFIIV